MRKTLFFLLWIAGAVASTLGQPLSSSGQPLSSSSSGNSSYHEDVKALRKILEKTPSFKTQIKGNARKIYQATYREVWNDSLQQPFSAGYFLNLCKLFYPLSDNHLAFYQIKPLISEENFPRMNISVDSLARQVAVKPDSSLEGIYHYGDYFSFVLFEAEPAHWVGLILNSNVPNWTSGQTIVHLYGTKSGAIRGVYAHPKFKTLMYQPNERLVNGKLINSSFYLSFSNDKFSKSSSNNANLSLNQNKFLREKEGNKSENSDEKISSIPTEKDLFFTQLSDSVSYLRIGHFSANSLQMKQSSDFLDSVREKLTGKHLIIDLRNNRGGAEKVSKNYLKLVSSFAKSGRLYVLINENTISQGEIFALQLKSKSKINSTYSVPLAGQPSKMETSLPSARILLFGQSTNGMLAYGSNYGRRVKLPSGLFEVYITDMFGKGGKKLLTYEDVGIQPHIVLSNKEDELLYVLNFIENQN